MFLLTYSVLNDILVLAQLDPTSLVILEVGVMKCGVKYQLYSQDDVGKIQENTHFKILLFYKMR